MARVAPRLIAAAARVQVQMTRRNVEDVFPILTAPLASLASLAVLTHSGRHDLVGYPLVAALLMGVGQMGVFAASEILANERQGQTLELIVASPAPYGLLLLTRMFLLTALGIAGFLEGWVIARLVFGLHVTVHHPWVFVLTLVFTLAAAAMTSLVTSAWFCFGKTTRTYQNAIAGPLYLLAGVLVPVTFLPDGVQPFSRVIFLFWSADLLRDSLSPSMPQDVPFRLAMIAVLGVIAAGAGAWLIARMLDHQRREGTLGI